MQRHCHNCHTREGPTWRKSVLFVGKIVSLDTGLSAQTQLCNKCGIYERTHRRSRPLEEDAKLRRPAGSAKSKSKKKSRAKSSATKSTPKPKPKSKPRPRRRAQQTASAGSSVQNEAPHAGPSRLRDEEEHTTAQGK